MNGYGLYVWASFSAVMISCAVFYFKNKKTLKKKGKEFLGWLQALTVREKNKANENSKNAQQNLTTSTKTN